MRTSLSVLCLADKIQSSEDPKQALAEILRTAWNKDGPAKTFFLDRNAKLVTELRERGLKLWGE